MAEKTISSALADMMQSYAHHGGWDESQMVDVLSDIENRIGKLEEPGEWGVPDGGFSLLERANAGLQADANRLYSKNDELAQERDSLLANVRDLEAKCFALRAERHTLAEKVAELEAPPVRDRPEDGEVIDGLRTQAEAWEELLELVQKLDMHRRAEGKILKMCSALRAERDTLVNSLASIRLDQTVPPEYDSIECEEEYDAEEWKRRAILWEIAAGEEKEKRAEAEKAVRQPVEMVECELEETKDELVSLHAHVQAQNVRYDELAAWKATQLEMIEKLGGQFDALLKT